MREPWKTIVVFALLGLAMAASSYAYAAFQDYTQPMNGFDFALMVVSVILCPAQLIFAFCIDCEVVGWDGFIMYCIIGFFNMAIYAVIGAIAVSFRKGTNVPTSGEQPPPCGGAA
jgi:hypothetical protein